MVRFAERTSRCDVQPLQRVGTPDLAPMFLREMQERQYVVTGGIHHGHGSWELLAQHLGYLLPVGSDLLRLLDHVHRLWPPADFVYMAAATMTWPALGTWLSNLRRKCTRHRCQLLLWNMRLIAAVMPR